MKGRVVFLIRLKPGTQDEFLEAYEGIRHLVAEGVPGHLVDQVCQSPEDPDNWLITSEWETLDRFLEWEREEEHREAERPHVLLVERDLDALRELLAHHLLQRARDFVDARLALLGADDRSAGRLGDVGELSFAFGRELGGECLAGLVLAEAGRLAVRADLRDRLGGAPADLDDVDPRLLLGGLPRDADGIALEVLAVGDEEEGHHHHGRHHACRGEQPPRRPGRRRRAARCGAV